MTSNAGVFGQGRVRGHLERRAPAERRPERELRGIEPPQRDDVVLAANLQHHPARGEVHGGVGVGLGLVRPPDAIDRPG